MRSRCEFRAVDTLGGYARWKFGECEVDQAGDRLLGVFGIYIVMLWVLRIFYEKS